MEESKVIDTNLLIDGFSGLTTIFNIIEYPTAFQRNVILFPERADFDKAVDISLRLRLKGNMIGAVDVIIASMCINRGLKLVTKDKDFNYVKEVDKNFKVEILN